MGDHYFSWVNICDESNKPPRPGPKFGIAELCAVLPVLLFSTLLPLPLSPLLLPVLGELCVLDWGAHGFGNGSLFSVRDGWLSPPEVELLTREANGLPPNYTNKQKKPSTELNRNILNQEQVLEQEHTPAILFLPHSYFTGVATNISKDTYLLIFLSDNDTVCLWNTDTSCQKELHRGSPSIILPQSHCILHLFRAHTN